MGGSDVKPGGSSKKQNHMQRFEPSKATDAQLIDRFENGRDQKAFAEIVRRHGQKVMSAGMRVLGNRADAEEVFQATFLALAMSVGTIRDKEALAGWLQRVARKSAVTLQRQNMRWGKKARRKMEHVTTWESTVRKDEPVTEVTNRDLVAVLDEELARLPAKLSTALMLCECDGLSQRKAAERLGISKSAFNERLLKARKLLRERLERRGIGVVVGALASAEVIGDQSALAMSEAIVSDMTASASGCAAGKTASEIGVSSRVFELAKSISSAMRNAKLLSIGAAALTLVFVASTLAVVSSSLATSRVGTIVQDDFVDGNLADSGWVVLGPVGLRGTADASTGDLVLTPNPQTANAQVSGLGFGLPEKKSVDMSVRSQVRISETGGSAIVNARLQESAGEEPFGYFAAIGYDPESGGTTFRAGRSDGLETWPTFFLPTVDTSEKAEKRHVVLPFDIRKKDAVIQLDVFGSRVRAWAWEAGTTMPSEAQFDATDDTYSNPGYAAVGLQNVSSSKSTGRSTSTFRYIHVADVPIHELD